MIKGLHRNACRCRDSEETRGVSDHGFLRSIYFRDPNGYVIELTARRRRPAAVS